MSETSINSSLSNSLQSIDGQNITNAIRNILVINCVVNIPLALTSFVGNTLVLYGVWKTPTLRSPSIILLCGLALSDLAVGIVAQPLFIVNNLLRVYSQSQNVKDVFSSVYNTFGYTLCGISLCTVAVISLDRLIAIEKALEYPRLVTIPRAKRVLVTIWIMCVLLPALQLSSLYIRVIRNWNRNFDLSRSFHHFSSVDLQNGSLPSTHDSDSGSSGGKEYGWQFGQHVEV